MRQSPTTFIKVTGFQSLLFRTAALQTWVLPPRVSSKLTKINFGSNRNKICFAFVSACFGKPKTKILVCFGVSNLYRNNWNKQICFVTNRNKHFVSHSAETSFGSSFGCFESKLFRRTPYFHPYLIAKYTFFKCLLAIIIHLYNVSIAEANLQKQACYNLLLFEMKCASAHL